MSCKRITNIAVQRKGMDNGATHSDAMQNSCSKCIAMYWTLVGASDCCQFVLKILEEHNVLAAMLEEEDIWGLLPEAIAQAKHRRDVLK